MLIGYNTCYVCLTSQFSLVAHRGEVLVWLENALPMSQSHNAHKGVQ